MISFSKKRVSLIRKISLIILAIYTLGFIFYKVVNYYKTYYEKEKLLQELQIKKNETNKLIKQLEENKVRIENLKNSYISKEELDTKIRDIFQRMSVFDYKLNLLDTKRMCIDRYILVASLSAQSESGLKAAEGILSYIGNMKKSDENSTIYFVDYLAKQKGNK